MTTDRVSEEQVQQRPGPPTPASPLGRLWNRQLPSYPNSGPRTFYLGITVLATTVLYYELFVQSSVATQILTDYHMSFAFFILISAVGGIVGAFASLIAGLADRWGRANLVSYGLLVTALLVLFGIPNAPNQEAYLVMFALVSFVEGIVLVATPALIRDFSPQLGRGVAMAFWTTGAVMGSLAVTEVSSHTLNSHPNWRFQFYVAGVVGLVVFVIALFGLRELSPQLRDQLMVSLRDRALVEARAAGIDPERALSGHWRQMLRLDVIGSAFAISVYLFIYYFAVGFLVLYCATVYGYSTSWANALANWYWITEVIVLVATGVLSDKLRVRKPFMLFGALIGLVGIGLFTTAATKPDTSYYTLAAGLVLAAAGTAIGYCAWMAAFTETVERHNPAATATGLAVWGWIVRVVYTLSLLALMVVVTAPSTLVDKGGRVQSIVAAHPKQIAVLSAVDPASAAALAKNPTDPIALPDALAAVARKQGAAPATVAQVRAVTARRIEQLRTAGAIDPGTLAKLSQNPPGANAVPIAQREVVTAFQISESQALQRLVALGEAKADLALVQPYILTLQDAKAAIPAADLAFLSANGAKVQKAAADSPRQWQRWFWVCFAAQLVFIPFIFVMAGRWSPRRVRADVREHERLVEQEMQLLLSGESPVLSSESPAVPPATPARQIRTP